MSAWTSPFNFGIFYTAVYEKNTNQYQYNVVNILFQGEYEYGSPKKPAIIEAMALNLADNTDAKLETMSEVLESGPAEETWLGWNRFFDTNLRRTGK